MGSASLTIGLHLMIGRGCAPSNLQDVALAFDGAAAMLSKADQPIVHLEELVGERAQLRILRAPRILTERGQQEPLAGGIALERLLPLALLDQRFDRARLLQRSSQERGGRHIPESGRHWIRESWPAR